MNLDNDISRSVETSQRTAAIVAGAGLLLMVIPAIFAASMHGSVFVPGDAAATANNVLANELQIRLAILSFLVVVALDVIVAWGLYVFFRPVDKHLSLLAGWFRLVYAAVFAAAILNLGNAPSIVRNADSLTPVGKEQMQAQAWLMLNAFSNGWDLALMLFGLHLILVGYLAYKLKAGYTSSILGVLLVIAGFGYMVDSVSGLLFPGFGVTVGQFTFIGELLLALWLLVKGKSTRLPN